MVLPDVDCSVTAVISIITVYTTQTATTNTTTISWSGHENTNRGIHQVDIIFSGPLDIKLSAQSTRSSPPAFIIVSCQLLSLMY